MGASSWEVGLCSPGKGSACPGAPCSSLSAVCAMLYHPAWLPHISHKCSESPLQKQLSGGPHVQRFAFTAPLHSQPWIIHASGHKGLYKPTQKWMDQDLQLLTNLFY